MTGGAIIRDNGTARLEAAGGGVCVVRLTAKMGIIGPGTFDVIEAALDHVGGHLSALVIAGAGPPAFSAGVDLPHLAGFVDRAEALDAFLHRGQQVFLGLATAPVPVVTAQAFAWLMKAEVSWPEPARNAQCLRRRGGR